MRRDSALLLAGITLLGLSCPNTNAQLPVAVNVTTAPAGLTISVDGTNYVTPADFNWLSASAHTLIAASPQTAPDGQSRNVFASWSDGGPQTNVISVPSSPTNYTATFSLQYLLDVAVTPAGAGTVSNNPAGPWYDAGQLVSLTARTNKGYRFVSWSGVDSQAGNTAQVTMNAYKAVNANYELALPGMTVTVYDSNVVAPGYVLLGSIFSRGPHFLMMLNNDGTTYKARLSGYKTPGDDYFALDFKVLPNGQLYAAQATGGFPYTGGNTDYGTFMDEDLNIVDTVQMGNGYLADNHDFKMLPNGHLLMMGYYTMLADIRSVRPTAYPRAEISGAIVQELDAHRHVIWQWRTWDYYGLEDFGFWGPRSTGSLLSGWHINSVMLDPIDSQMLVATTEEAMKINRQTGEVMWRLGGDHNQFAFTGTGADSNHFAGHTFQRLDNGNLLVLFNAQGLGTNTSSVEEYELDEANKIVRRVWGYTPTNRVDTWARGSAQRLPNGNTFIGWGSSNDGNNQDCTEVTPAGRVVWEMRFNSPLMDTYRAFRYVYPPSTQRIQSVQNNLVAGNDYSFGDAGVTLGVQALTSVGANTVTATREPYSPMNPQFAGKAPMLLQTRVFVSQTGIDSLTATLSFDTNIFKVRNPANTTVYYRPVQGQGVFSPLGTTFASGQLQAALPGYGEFTLGYPDLTEIPFPPMLNQPDAWSTNSFLSRRPAPINFIAPVPPLAQAGQTYTVNQSLPVALSWSPKGFAASYTLQISTNPDFSLPVVDLAGLVEARYAFSNALPITTYYWRVNTTNAGGLSSWADSSFTTIPPTVHVTAPNGGELWTRGLKYFIEWDDNLQENVIIDLYKGGVFLKSLATNESTVSYQWEAGLTLAPGSDYSIKVRSVTNTPVSDMSDGNFGLDVPIIDAASIIWLEDGRFQFSFTAGAGAATQATVWGATQLDPANWQLIKTVPLSGGFAVFTDNTATNYPARFYRVRVP